MKRTVFLTVLLLVPCIVPAQSVSGISARFAASFTDRFADPEMIRNVGSSSTVDWQTGYDMFAIEHIWRWTGDERYFNYIRRCVDRGLVPVSEYQPVIDRAYDGLLSKCIRNTDGFYNLTDCSSIGTKRSYEEYVSQPHEISTFASMASFMLASGMVEWRRSHPNDSPLHSFYCTDYSGGRILKMEDGKAVWTHDAPLSNDLWVLDNGNVLFTTGNGVLELDSKGGTVFCYNSSSRIFACQRLRNGNTFIGECSSGRLLEVNAKGKVVRAVSIASEGEKPDDGYIRNARRLDNGHYLVAHYSGKKVVEYDSHGKVVWQAEVPGGAHSVARMPDGHTLVAATDKDRNPRIMEFDAGGKLVWSLSNSNLDGNPLKFLSGFQYLADSDSFLITNWQGHNSNPKAPHILRVTRDGKILESFGDNPDFRTVSSIFVPGKGRIH